MHFHPLEIHKTLPHQIIVCDMSYLAKYKKKALVKVNVIVKKGFAILRESWNCKAIEGTASSTMSWAALNVDIKIWWAKGGGACKCSPLCERTGLMFFSVHEECAWYMRVKPGVHICRCIYIRLYVHIRVVSPRDANSVYVRVARLAASPPRPLEVLDYNPRAIGSLRKIKNSVTTWW